MLESERVVRFAVEHMSSPEDPPRPHTRAFLEGRDRKSFEPELRRLGVRIAERREQLELSQGALAERCGLSRTSVNRIEAGLFDPRTVTLLRLARGLECHVVDLFG